METEGTCQRHQPFKFARDEERRGLRKQVVREGSGTNPGLQIHLKLPMVLMQFPLGQTP